MVITLHRRKIVRFLLGFIVFLGVAGIISAAVRIKAGGGYWLYFFTKFDIDGNWNIAIWYSSVALLFAAILAWAIGRAARHTGGTHVRHWFWLAVILALMAFDEAMGFHGILNYPMRRYVISNEMLFFPWVIAGLLFVAVVSALYLHMVLALPRPVKWRILVAGAVFVVGAVGMEVASGLALFYFSDQPWAYQACAITEEIMEKLGILILIDAFLIHLGTIAPQIEVQVCGGDPPANDVGGVYSP